MEKVTNVLIGIVYFEKLLISMDRVPKPVETEWPPRYPVMRDGMPDMDYLLREQEVDHERDVDFDHLSLDRWGQLSQGLAEGTSSKERIGAQEQYPPTTSRDRVEKRAVAGPRAGVAFDRMRSWKDVYLPAVWANVNDYSAVAVEKRNAQWTETVVGRGHSASDLARRNSFQKLPETQRLFLEKEEQQFWAHFEDQLKGSTSSPSSSALASGENEKGYWRGVEKRGRESQEGRVDFDKDFFDDWRENTVRPAFRNADYVEELQEQALAFSIQAREAAAAVAPNVTYSYNFRTNYEDELLVLALGLHITSPRMKTVLSTFSRPWLQQTGDGTWESRDVRTGKTSSPRNRNHEALLKKQLFTDVACGFRGVEMNAGLAVDVRSTKGFQNLLGPEIMREKNATSSEWFIFFGGSSLAAKKNTTTIVCTTTVIPQILGSVGAGGLVVPIPEKTRIKAFMHPAVMTPPLPRTDPRKHKIVKNLPENFFSPEKVAFAPSSSEGGQHAYARNSSTSSSGVSEDFAVFISSLHARAKESAGKTQKKRRTLLVELPSAKIGPLFQHFSDDDAVFIPSKFYYDRKKRNYVLALPVQYHVSPETEEGKTGEREHRTAVVRVTVPARQLGDRVYRIGMDAVLKCDLRFRDPADFGNPQNRLVTCEVLKLEERQQLVDNGVEVILEEGLSAGDVEEDDQEGEQKMLKKRGSTIRPHQDPWVKHFFYKREAWHFAEREQRLLENVAWKRHHLLAAGASANDKEKENDMKRSGAGEQGQQSDNMSCSGVEQDGPEEKNRKADEETRQQNEDKWHQKRPWFFAAGHYKHLQAAYRLLKNQHAMPAVRDPDVLSVERKMRGILAATDDERDHESYGGASWKVKVGKCNKMLRTYGLLARPPWWHQTRLSEVVLDEKLHYVNVEDEDVEMTMNTGESKKSEETKSRTNLDVHLTEQLKVTYTDMGAGNKDLETDLNRLMDFLALEEEREQEVANGNTNAPGSSTLRALSGNRPELDYAWLARAWADDS
eukprot:g6681.t1